MTRVILASASPRRKELLSLLEIPFEIKVADVDEHIDEDNDLVEEIESLSFKKALAIFRDNKDAVVIGADTIVTLNDEVLGKPKDKEDAIDMLCDLENATHEVITAVTIISNQRSETFSVVSKVTFNPMTLEEIVNYVESGEPLDKAGAYAVQGLGAKFIKQIHGDYYAIMGLPVSELYCRIKKYL